MKSYSWLLSRFEESPRLVDSNSVAEYRHSRFKFELEIFKISVKLRKSGFL